MSQKQRLLEDKVAWVTGGASGYGKHYAMRLAQEGCKVAICDVDETGGKAVAKEIQEKSGGKVFFKKVDVRIKSEVDLFAKEVCEHLNGLDIAVSNAGVMGGAPFLELEESEWDRIIAVNLKGCFLCAQAAGKVMVEHKIPGNIVNIGSDAAFFGQRNIAHYATSKAGVVMLTKVMALELAKYGIRVNCLCPGIARTEGLLGGATGEERERLEERVKKTPLGGRAANLEEIANCLIFLVSPQSSYVTGHAFVADGGFTAGLG